MTAEAQPDKPAKEVKVDVLIVGGGFSGLCMAIKLREAGMNSFLLIEKSDDIGGTWYDNRYPGCACDIPSHLYSFSFEPSPDWSRMYPGQQEIHDYLKLCVERYKLAPNILLNTRLQEAIWNEAEGDWHATASEGLRIKARVLVSGIGGLHVPQYPKIEGLEKFVGPHFHSSTWDHGVDLQGKNVAVLGTGASSIQFVPQIAPRAAKLYLFQRTPPWIVPRIDFAIPEKWKRRFRRFPLAMRAFRQYIFWRQEVRVLGFLGNRTVRRKATEIATRHMQRQIKDPKLREALTPRYELGCKRVLVSDDFYPTLTRENVELVTEHIAEVREHTIVTADGAERPVDILIFGTGFPRNGAPHRHPGGRPRRHANSRCLARAHERVSRRHRQRLPQFLFAARAQHRLGAQLGRLDDRGASPLRDELSEADEAPKTSRS